MSEQRKYPWADGYTSDQLLKMLKQHRHAFQPGQLSEAIDKISDELSALKAQRDELLAALQMALADHMTEAYLHPLRDGTVEAIRCAIASAEKPPCD